MCVKREERKTRRIIYVITSFLLSQKNPIQPKKQSFPVLQTTCNKNGLTIWPIRYTAPAGACIWPKRKIKWRSRHQEMTVFQWSYHLLCQRSQPERTNLFPASLTSEAINTHCDQFISKLTEGASVDLAGKRYSNW